MRKVVPVLVAVGLIILIAVGFVGFQVLDRYMPTKERADLAEVYDVSGDETAILYNYERQEQTGIYENGQTYLPVSWVNDHINERFYWDSTEDLLVYALPDQIVYADAETKGSNGAPLLLVKDEEVYLTLGLIANYTDVQIQTFDSGDGRRVLINDWGTRNIARVKKAGSLRVKGGVKSKILTDLAKDDTVTVLDTMEKWSKVASSNGNIGYVENKRLAAAESQKFSGNFTAPVYKNTSMSGKIVLGWHQVTSQDGNNTFDSIVAKTKGMNVISPTWFSLTDNNGNYKSLASKDYVAKAHAKGLQVWALIDNFSADVQTETLLASTSTRRKLIDSLIADVGKYDLDGLNLDFESLKKEAGVHYIEFIRELSVKCRQNGLVLSVDNYVPKSFNTQYDRKEQGIVADYVVIMGYDEYYAGSPEAGPVSSYNYVKEGITETLKEVPAEKVISGIPFFTRLWKETPKTEEELKSDKGTDAEQYSTTVESDAYGMDNAQAIVKQAGVDTTWDKKAGQNYATWEADGSKYEIWMEDSKSIEAKLKLMKKYKLAGTAEWSLGQESSDIWNLIQKYVN